MKKIAYVLCGASIVYTGNTLALQQCDVTAGQWYDQGQYSVVVCDESLPGELAVSSADETPPENQIRLTYQQPLARCQVDDKRAGFHLVFDNVPAGRVNELILSDVNDKGLCKLSFLADKPGINNQKNTFQIDEADAKFITIDGIRTRYYEFGDGQPVLLVHGGNAGGSNNNAMKWEQNIPGLAKHFRVIALDRLAQAGTDNLKMADEYNDYFAKDAQHLRDFFQALDLNNAIVIGHSQGGWPATRLALDEHDKVSCLVNIDTVLVPDDFSLMKQAVNFLLYVSRYLHPDEGPTLYSAMRGMELRYPSGQGLSKVKAQRVVDQHFSPKSEQARLIMKSKRMSPLHPSFKKLKEQAHADIRAGQLKARSLVVWGEQDPQVPLGLGKLFQQLMLDAKVSSDLVVINNAGHAPFIEFPEQFNQDVIEYCKD